MKGAVFIALNEMIEEQHGLGTWLDILDQTGLEGVFTSTETYPDEALFKIVAAVCETLKAPAPDVLRAFGEYLFDFLHKAHPVFAESQSNFFDFISSIDGVIHVEIHKLDENAQTPKIWVERADESSATLSYQSPRKLCHLAEGLLKGAARYYGISIAMEHGQCMHDGAPHCHLHLTQVTPE